MKFIKNHVIILSLFAVFFLTILIINYRTPFYTSIGGSWSVGVGSTQKFLPQLPSNTDELISYTKLKAKINSTVFIADPFFIKVKDTFYLFVEHQHNTPNAVVSLFKSLDGMNYNYDRVVLKENFHLSYPQVFEYKNEFYMLPETTQSGNVLLYKAHNFPYDWRVNDTLIKNTKLKDPTIFLSDSLNFMYGSDSNLNLKLYVSDSLTGNWKLHKKPLMAMGTEARPGGRIIPKDDKFIIPLQNSQNGYGSGLSLYEIKFTQDSYSFNLVEKLYLKRQDTISEFTYGMHHLDFQIVDGKYFYVYDGNIRLSNSKINLWGPLKWNYLDLKNYIYQF